MARDQRRGGHDGHAGDSVQDSAGVRAEIRIENIGRSLRAGSTNKPDEKKEIVFQHAVDAAKNRSQGDQSRHQEDSGSHVVLIK